MKLSREEKRARLEAKAGKVIEEALEWEEQHPEASLTEMEDIILRLRKELGKDFPLDEQLRLRDKHWSEGVAKRAVKYSGKLSYGEAAEALVELGQIDISAKSVWRLTQHWGAVMKRVEAQEDIAANRKVESTATGKVEEKRDVRLGAAMDGAMIYVRGEEWKELKVGCLYEVETEPTLDPEIGDWIEVGHARKTSYVSHLGGPEEFGRKMWTEAKRRDWLHALDTQVVGDAAKGWLIGSGMVESGGKRFKDRLTSSGMHWSRTGAERLLPVRGAIMSRRFDECWQKAYNSPPI